MTPALEIADLERSFGALHVTRHVSMALLPGARHALIGPNGAGKTTLVNLITGALRPDGGRILAGGEEVTALSEPARVRKGLARTFQITELFRELTTLENVALSVAERRRRGWRFLGRQSRESETIDETMGLLESLGLADDALTPVHHLPYGRQRLVEVAVTLGQRPRVLLLDEPAAGVPSTESHLILDVLASLPEEIAILIIEHDMDVVFSFARSVTVLVDGAILTEGTPDEIARDPEVRTVYLGETGSRERTVDADADA